MLKERFLSNHGNFGGHIMRKHIKGR